MNRYGSYTSDAVLRSLRILQIYYTGWSDSCSCTITKKEITYIEKDIRKEVIKPQAFNEYSVFI